MVPSVRLEQPYKGLVIPSPHILSRIFFKKREGLSLVTKGKQHDSHSLIPVINSYYGDFLFESGESIFEKSIYTYTVFMNTKIAPKIYTANLTIPLNILSIAIFF